MATTDCHVSQQLSRPIRKHGTSTRAIGAAEGVSKSTVREDLARGRNRPPDDDPLAPAVVTGLMATALDPMSTIGTDIDAVAEAAHDVAHEIAHDIAHDVAEDAYDDAYRDAYEDAHRRECDRRDIA